MRIKNTYLNLNTYKFFGYTSDVFCQKARAGNHAWELVWNVQKIYAPFKRRGFV